MSEPMTNKPKILIVEDEMIIARELVMHVHELGYESVGQARTAEEAIAMAEQLRPDLILMDVHLAGAMTGITAAKIIKTRFGVLSIMLSAFVDSDSLAEAELAEPAGYLNKPFEVYELQEVLKIALAR